jgi:ADP-ribosylglycohydrolase
MLGLMVGDAAGAVLEMQGAVTADEVDWALTLPGGGIHEVAPGQVTDDSELAMALYRAVNKHGGIWRQSTVCYEYLAWAGSRPFDMGNTCGNALRIMAEYQAQDVPEAQLLAEIEDLNAASQANGALMRVTGLVLATLKYNPAADFIDIDYYVRNAALQDAQLTHPNSVCQVVNVAYATAQAKLLTTEQTPREIYFNLVVWLRDYSERGNKACKVLLDWLSEDVQTLDCTQNPGHVRHAWILAMHWLRHSELDYLAAIRFTLSKGGDTDTNAAIVGALAACRHEVPDQLVQRVLTYTGVGGRPRPNDFVPRSFFANVF